MRQLLIKEICATFMISARLALNWGKVAQRRADSAACVSIRAKTAGIHLYLVQGLGGQSCLFLHVCACLCELAKTG